MRRDLVGNYDHMRSTYGVLRWKRHELMVFCGAKSTYKNCGELGLAPGFAPDFRQKICAWSIYRALTPWLLGHPEATSRSRQAVQIITSVVYQRYLSVLTGVRICSRIRKAGATRNRKCGRPFRSVIIAGA